MEKIWRKVTDLPKLSRKKTGVLAVGGALILLIVLLCITINMRAHIQSEYSFAREEIGAEAYTQLYMLCQTFDQVTVPGQDVQNVVIPTMKDYYLVASSLSDVLDRAFGERYKIFTGDDIAMLDAAFEAYDSAFRAGKSTSGAQESMQRCIDRVREILNTRFRDGVLKAS